MNLAYGGATTDNSFVQGYTGPNSTIPVPGNQTSSFFFFFIFIYIPLFRSLACSIPPRSFESLNENKKTKNKTKNKKQKNKQKNTKNKKNTQNNKRRSPATVSFPFDESKHHPGTLCDLDWGQ